MGNEIEKKGLNLPVEWAITEAALDAIKTMNAAMNTVGRHGIVSSIPIICRAEDCPYYQTCPLRALGVSVTEIRGQRCPVEVTKIMRKFEEYVEQFNIDLENVDHVVISLVKELIDYDIQIERADNVMASDGHFLSDEVVGVDANGRPIKNKIISKPVDYKERALKKRHEILGLLNSTPKDKAGTNLTISFDPSTYAAKLMQRARELKEAEVIVVESEVIDE